MDFASPFHGEGFDCFFVFFPCSSSLSVGYADCRTSLSRSQSIDTLRHWEVEACGVAWSDGMVKSNGKCGSE